VHDFVTHIYGGPEELQRALDNLDGTVDTRTKTAGIGKIYLHHIMIPCFNSDSRGFREPLEKYQMKASSEAGKTTPGIPGAESDIDPNYFFG